MTSCLASVGNIEVDVDERYASSGCTCHALFGSWGMGGFVPSGGPYGIHSTPPELIPKALPRCRDGATQCGTKSIWPFHTFQSLKDFEHISLIVASVEGNAYMELITD
jgi:hypothetical protein